MIQLPNDTAGKRYATLHFEFFTKYLELSGQEFEFVNPTSRIWYRKLPNCISIVIDDKQAIIDFGDHKDAKGNVDSSIIYFKFQYNDETEDDNMKPLGPLIISPCDRPEDLFATYFRIKQRDLYDPYNANIIQCRQKAYGNALERRRKVRDILLRKFGVAFDGRNQKKYQSDFWRSQSKCLTSVCIPGQREDILDRGQWELMGLGVCTISTHLTTLLPHYEELWPGQHYIECKPDFSDLIEKIEWLRENPWFAKEIGNHAKELFDTVFLPHKYWEWITNETRKFYE